MKKSQLNQIRPSASRAVRSAGAALAALLALNSASALAAPFTLGNLVVERVGSGAAALTSAGTPIFFDEFTTGGSSVQSIAIPTSGTSALVESGTASSDGGMNLSLDGKSLAFPGYATNSGVSGVTSATALAVPRGIGKLDFNGNYTLAATSTTAFSGNNIRGAATDGNNNFWATGTYGSGNTTGGLQYFGTASAAAQVFDGATTANLRSIGIYNGSLWYSTASSTALSYGIFEFNGLPTTASQPTKIIPLTSAYGSYSFSVNNNTTVIYVADDGDESATNAGIHKWVNNNGTWTQSYLLISNTPCFGLAVNWTTMPPTLYATTGAGATNNAIISLQDTGVSATTNVLATAGINTYRGLSFAPAASTPASAPVITGINPSAVATNAGNTVTFTLTGNTGYPYSSNYWYKVSGGVTTLLATATGTSLTLNNVQPTDAASYYAVLSNATGSATSGVVSLTINAGPTITGISPTSETVSAGQNVSFSLTASLGTPAATVAWYQIVGNTSNLISGATSTTLSLNHVLAGNSGGYYAILKNSASSVTSSVATLTVTGDPAILTQPASVEAFQNGTAEFTVGVAATSPAYQWYQFDGVSAYAPLVNGAQPSGSVVSGATTGTLTFTGVQPADATNFVVVVTDNYGSVTSSIASLYSVSLTGQVIAFWDFNGTQFTNTAANPTALNNPVPLLGLGTAGPVGSCYDPGTSPFSGSVDTGDDGAGTYVPGTDNTFLSPSPYFSWGTDNYPLTGGNKQNGVQFNVSTLGAKDIQISYDSRVSATASDYERLQYTTDGSTWIDFPASSTFGGVGTTYLLYTYNLTGFPGVDNNPNFAFRVVTEYQSTATYGIGTTNTYVGTANSYGTAGTVTYDRVTVTGDSYTNTINPPAITSTFTNVTTADYVPVTLNFTVSDPNYTGDQLTYSATTLGQVNQNNPAPTVNANYTFGGSGANRTLTITPSPTQDQVDASPVAVTVTDPNGYSTVTWFDLTLTSVNLAPTNSLTSLVTTNTLANSAITIPFTVADDRTPVSGLTYSVASGNNTVVSNANISVINQGTANPSLVIIPNTNEVGLAQVSVTVNDNDSLEPRSTTANIEFMVRPNTNVVLVDYFNYDNSGSLDTLSSGFWNHLSGNFGQLKADNDVAVVDTLDNTENLQAPLLNGPYATNSGVTLYDSFTVNMDSTRLPVGNGTYFALFNDGSGVTGPYEGRVLAATNGAAPGYYRIGIANFGSSATNGVMFPLDLAPGSNYVVVSSLSLTNGFSTVWVNPSSQSSFSVTDPTPAPTPTNLYKIAKFELRESGGAGGSISLGSLKVGTTFDSVFPSLHIQSAGSSVILNWSDPTLGVQTSTNVAGPYVDLPGATSPYTNIFGSANVLFYRFGQ
jgi:hypothetical protein